MSDARAKALLGREIVIGVREARFGSRRCASPAYTVEEQGVAEFLLDFKLTSAQLPLPGSRLRTLVVGCRGDPFDRLTLLENGCGLYSTDGRFFAAVKQSRRGSATRERAACKL